MQSAVMLSREGAVAHRADSTVYTYAGLTVAKR